MDYEKRIAQLNQKKNEELLSLYWPEIKVFSKKVMLAVCAITAVFFIVALWNGQVFVAAILSLGAALVGIIAVIIFMIIKAAQYEALRKKS